MAIRWYANGGRRYYVIDVGGSTIVPGSGIGAGGGGHGMSATYAVLDRDWGHREVGTFIPKSGYSRAHAEAEAHALAAELNALEKGGE